MTLNWSEKKKLNKQINKVSATDNLADMRRKCF